MSDFIPYLCGTIALCLLCLAYGRMLGFKDGWKERIRYENAQHDKHEQEKKQ